jgi:hypothetical protein
MENQNKAPTHVAVPIEVYQGVLKILGTMPYDQVSPAIQALSNCPALSMASDAKPGDLVKGASSGEQKQGIMGAVPND